MRIKIGWVGLEPLRHPQILWKKIPKGLCAVHIKSPMRFERLTNFLSLNDRHILRYSNLLSTDVTVSAVLSGHRHGTHGERFAVQAFYILCYLKRYIAMCKSKPSSALVSQALNTKYRCQDTHVSYLHVQNLLTSIYMNNLRRIYTSDMNSDIFRLIFRYSEWPDPWIYLSGGLRKIQISLSPKQPITVQIKFADLGISRIRVLRGLSGILLVSRQISYRHNPCTLP